MLLTLHICSSSPLYSAFQNLLLALGRLPVYKNQATRGKLGLA
ncbi:hypothetical protein HMPREF0291_10045 [Corynebacterium genitalium ATCC 33030]|uniref:Uncharacterized protein n=1 Tax=Corynebacterium genitalium ATCC 33030 TaxID=585529 RepID=D7WAA6_9CORY|nr:hypothetical protein HMPREF0291_10045 [Corynebacterium genitalium ATCC 33030]